MDAKEKKKLIKRLYLEKGIEIETPDDIELAVYEAYHQSQLAESKQKEGEGKKEKRKFRNPSYCTYTEKCYDRVCELNTDEKCQCDNRKPLLHKIKCSDCGGIFMTPDVKQTICLGCETAREGKSPN